MITTALRKRTLSPVRLVLKVTYFWTAVFGALKNIFADKYLSEELTGEVYKALILPSLLYGPKKHFC